MGATVYVEREKCDHLRLANNTGADLVQGEFTLVGGYPAVADEPIANNAVGSFHVEPNIVCQASEFSTGEGTFPTANAEIYFDPVDKKFSNTKSADVYGVGRVTEILTGGVVRFAKYHRAIKGGEA